MEIEIGIQTRVMPHTLRIGIAGCLCVPPPLSIALVHNHRIKAGNGDIERPLPLSVTNCRQTDPNPEAIVLFNGKIPPRGARCKEYASRSTLRDSINAGVGAFIDPRLDGNSIVSVRRLRTIEASAQAKERQKNAH